MTLVNEQSADGIDPVIELKVFNSRLVSIDKEPRMVGMLPVKELAESRRSCIAKEATEVVLIRELIVPLKRL